MIVPKLHYKQFNINVDFVEENGVVLYVIKNNEFIGYLVIGDEVKENVKSVINELKSNGIKKTVILSGDNINNVKQVANEVVVDDYFAELLPVDKVNKVEELQKSATKYVSAKGQAIILNNLLDNNLLNEEEIDVVKRGRNYKRSSHPKHTDIITYKLSTGFEALIGYLYLSKKTQRLEEILKHIEVK